ncbi:lytic transglycosylase domain-containing protein [Stenotrophomonas maltophilia]|uniref:lytic transglycosylase domain-containing protein n=1 Tax=Stenotrophomonas maltophilia TaxID=40324 RepID=UPI003D7C40DD
MIVDVAQMAECGDLAVPVAIMEHVVRVESSFNRFAIGVVGGRLQRQPRTLEEAVATANALRDGGWNYSVGLSQVNQSNLKAQDLADHQTAFDICPNLKAGARILADCRDRYGSWGNAFSCYYSGNPRTGYTHGYVDRIRASMTSAGKAEAGAVIAVIRDEKRAGTGVPALPARIALRLAEASGEGTDAESAEQDPARIF